MLRRGVGCPVDLAYVQLGERFGKWPWEIKDQPASEVLYYLGVMGVEGAMQARLDGLPRDEALIEWRDD